MSKIQGTLAQWRDRLRRKELSPAELVNLTADAIEADRTTNAYISFDREAALHAAAGADISSPLAGIPIAVKDNINVLGQPTRCASRLLSPYVAPYDATSIRLLKELTQDKPPAAKTPIVRSRLCTPVRCVEVNGITATTTVLDGSMPAF